MMNQPTPLIVRIPNWLGDAIRTLPALNALKNAGFEVKLLLKPYLFDVFKATDFELLPVHSDTKIMIQQLKKISGQNMLLFANGFRIAWIAKWAAKKSVGYRKGENWFLLKKSFKKLGALNELEYFWNIAKEAAHYWNPQCQWPNAIPEHIELPIAPIHLEEAKKKLIELQITEPYWVLCPLAYGTGINKASRIWPHWRNFSKKLKEQGIIMVACPGPGEEIQCREFLEDAHILSGINLGVYAAILSQAQQVVSNDTGPMHLASAVNSRVLGILGTTDPRHARPWGRDYVGELNRWPLIEEVMARLNFPVVGVEE